jgi:hypothetical protein
VCKKRHGEQGGQCQHGNDQGIAIHLLKLS